MADAHIVIKNRNGKDDATTPTEAERTSMKPSGSKQVGIGVRGCWGVWGWGSAVNMGEKRKLICLSGI